MRLFLSSYRAGEHDVDLKEFIGGINKVAVITNAKDYKRPQDRNIKVQENFDYWRSIGLKPTEIDLRLYFHGPGAEKFLARHNFIWLAGGNVFLLRRALKYSGIDKYLGDAVRKNEVILGGESAGAIIMGPTLKYSEMDNVEDSPHFIPDGYDQKIIWEGLDFITYVPVPHYQDPGYGSEIDGYIRRLEQHDIPHRKITNDQAVTINGYDEKLLD
jgi:dipeptidase E